MPVSTSAAPAPVNKSSSLGSHRAVSAITLCFHVLLRLPYGCGSITSRVPQRCGLTLGLLIRHHGRLSGLLNDNIKGTLSRGRLLRLLQAQELLQPGDMLLVGTEFPPLCVQLLLDSFLPLSLLLVIPSTGQQLNSRSGVSLSLRGGPLERPPCPGSFLGPP